MVATDQRLEQQQLDIEQGFVEAGVERLRRRERASARRTGRATTKVGRDLVRHCFDQLECEIENMQRRVLQARKLPRAALPLIALEPGTLAFVCLHVAVSAMREKEVQEGRWPPLAQLARDIGRRCQREYKLAMKARVKTLRAPDITKKLLRRNKNVWNAEARTARLVATLDKDWAIGDRDLHLGIQLLHLAIQHCTLDGKPVFERNLASAGRGEPKKNYAGLGLTEAGEEWLQVRQQTMEEFATPVFLPMIVPPCPWTSISVGGYRTEFDLRLVKMRNERAVEAALQNADLQAVLRSVNALQETPWRINQDVYKVMRKYWTRQRIHGTPFPGAPPLEKQTMPCPPTESDSEDVAKEKRAARAKAFRRNIRAIGFRATMRIRLSMCRKLVPPKIERFYFPYQLDKRGRVYPIPQAIHPQTDDIGRALLEFADGKPIGTDGARWLAIHLANLHGEDKIPFREREQWVVKHEPDILACCKDPLSTVALEFWSKADKPWCFLAACFEWRDYKGNKQAGSAFRSHLPVSVDGTCNGLQHLSALGRDEAGGKATNLVPAEGPSDVYKEVAERVDERVAQDRDKGVSEALAWSVITRDLAKHATMTTPYGVTRDGIKKALIERIEDGNLPFSFPHGTHDPWKSAEYLAKVLEECIAAVVSKSSEIKEWLHDLIDALAERDRGLRWSVPTGFVVLHDYRQVREARVKTALGSLVVYRGKERPKINLRKQRNAIVPNLIHSLDAAHMMMTVNHLYDLDVRHFAMIHDSYGVHASDVPLMNRVLREEFVKVYTPNVIRRFFEEQRTQNPDVSLPEPPALGRLAIKRVLRSEYFFA